MKKVYCKQTGKEAVTDEDMIPLVMLDETISLIRLRDLEKLETVRRIINQCKEEINQTFKKLGIESVKI